MQRTQSFDSIIFDLDGTLWDGSRAMTHAINDTYMSLGLNTKLSEQEIRHLVSLPYSEYSSILLADIPYELQHDVLPLLLKALNSALDNYPNLALYPDSIECLNELSKQYKLYIVSNCGIAYLEAFLKNTSVGHLFIDSLCHGHNRNPKAKNIKLIINKHNLASPCYIGDSSSDEVASNTAGVKFYYAGYGACYNPSFSSAEAFNSFNEIKRYFF